MEDLSIPHASFATKVGENTNLTPSPGFATKPFTFECEIELDIYLAVYGNM